MDGPADRRVKAVAGALALVVVSFCGVVLFSASHVSIPSVQPSTNDVIHAETNSASAGTIKDAVEKSTSKTNGANGDELSTDLKFWVDWAISAMDTKVDPCTDFYEYACGTFLKNFKLPPELFEWWMRENWVEANNRDKLEEIMKGEWPIVTNFYKSCSNAETRQDVGAAPLAPYLKKIGGVKSLKSLFSVAGELFSIGANVFFELAVVPNARGPEFLLDIAQGGLNLPSNSLYAEKKTLAGYVAHITRVFELLYADSAVKDVLAEINSDPALIAAAVVKVEQKLLTLFDDAPGDNPEDITHYKTITELKTTAASLPWRSLFLGLGTPGIEVFNVQRPKYLIALNDYLSAADTALPDLQAYLLWSLVHKTIGFLPEAYALEDYKFFGQTLQGLAKPLAARFLCITQADQEIGGLLGHYYVVTNLSPDIKENATKMATSINEAFLENLPGLSWMDAAAKKNSAKKIEKMEAQIGYPNEWPDYDGLEVSKDDYYSNVLAARKFNTRALFSKVGKPAKFFWTQSVPTVNAYFEASYNAMCVPAGQLQVPDYSLAYPSAATYGSVGRIIGHEVIHGFDNAGFHYDWNGKLAEWVSPEVAAEFENKTKCVVDLYNRFEVEPGYFVDGQLTLGENIADIGGTKIAYWAFKKHIEKIYGPDALDQASVIPGLTQNQLFWVSYGQSWCKAVTPESERLQLKTNVHSPGKARCNVPIQQFEEFGKAFSCPVGSPMRPKAEDTCDIWWAVENK